MTREELVGLLDKHRINWRAWGTTDKSKTIDHLLREIHDGESTLEANESGQLVREVVGISISIFCTVNGHRYKLIEDRQVFTDGRKRRRDLHMSIGEKLRTDELPITAARRAFSEELGITDHDDLTFCLLGWTKKGPVPSKSFPGLQTFFLMKDFEVDLPAKFFKPEGYIEKQPDKTSYFVWREV